MGALRGPNRQHGVEAGVSDVNGESGSLFFGGSGVAQDGSTFIFGSETGVTFVHKNGSDGTLQSGTRYNFSLGLTPTSVLAVDVDGVPIYSGVTPGFSWTSGTSVVSIDVGQAIPTAAKIHFRLGL